MKVVAIIVSAGQGRRMGRPKSFLKIAGKPLLWWTLAVFQKTKLVEGIILVVNPKDSQRAKRLKFSKIIKIIPGGVRRQDSVFNGLKALPEEAEMVIIHDGVRPCITSEIITQATKAGVRYGAAVVGIPIKDTVKRIEEKSSLIYRTLDREKLWQAQTPQVFQKEIIQKAYRLGYTKYVATDDSFLVEKAGFPVRLIAGSHENVKITTPEDLIFAEIILKKKRG